jgi:hypothetical protein
MAEIIELRPARTELDDQIFNAVLEMQEDLRALDEFADALSLVSRRWTRAHTLMRLIG